MENNIESLIDRGNYNKIVHKIRTGGFIKTDVERARGLAIKRGYDLAELEKTIQTGAGFVLERRLDQMAKTSIWDDDSEEVIRKYAREYNLDDGAIEVARRKQAQMVYEDGVADVRRGRHHEKIPELMRVAEYFGFDTEELDNAVKNIKIAKIDNSD
jgi:hypothetical protein